MPKALGLRPSALVLVMSPLDPTSHQEMPDVVKAAELAPPASFRQRLSGLLKTVKDAVNNDSRRMLVARRIGFGSNDAFIRHGLAEGRTGYLWQPLDPRWPLRLEVANETIERVASQADAAGVRLVVVLTPVRVPAILSPDGVDRRGTDPFALGQALAKIVQAHGADFVDLTRMTRTLRDPGDPTSRSTATPTQRATPSWPEAIKAALGRVGPDFASCGHAR
jgi:hypothetical protein